MIRRPVRTYQQDLEQFQSDLQNDDMDNSMTMAADVSGTMYDDGDTDRSVEKQRKDRRPAAAGVSARSRSQPLLKALQITSAKMLEELMASPDNVAIDFYKKECPYCKTLSPIWNQIARQVHTTNNEPGVVPIIVAKMDAIKYLPQLEELRPGWSDGRGYPSLLFKRVNPQDGTVEATEWDHKVPRTYENLLDFMSEYYGDPLLKPHSIDLIQLMRNPQPEFTFMYSNATPVVLRFSTCLSDTPMIDIAEGNVVCSAAFYRYPELARRGAALPVNELDRRDFPVPAIVDNRTGKDYKYRDCQRWIKQQVERMQATTTEAVA